MNDNYDVKDVITLMQEPLKKDIQDIKEEIKILREHKHAQNQQIHHLVNDHNMIKNEIKTITIKMAESADNIKSINGSIESITKHITGQATKQAVYLSIWKSPITIGLLFLAFLGALKYIDFDNFLQLFGK